MTPRLFQYCRDRQDWLLDLIHALVTIESPTDNKGAVDRCGAVLADRLRSIGAAVTAVPQTAAGDHLLARFGTGGRQVLVIGHFDTVWPLGQLDRMPFREDAGRLHGPGVLDMKAGIALGMLATRALVDLAPSSDTRITMLWTTDEETGSDTSRALIEAEARQSEAVLVLEPALAGGALKTARKGVGQYELSVHGLSAHAGVDPRKGVNAIRELALQVLAVDAIRDLDRGISVNVGVISGGTRSNVVPDFATASVDVRAETMADADGIDRAMRALAAQTAGARLEVDGGFNRPPMERSAGVVRLFETARACAAEIGIALQEGATGGGSDGNFTAALGVPTLDGLGAVGDGAHALHEHVEVAPLPARAAIIAGLLYRLTQAAA
ncbi:MAG TPA: M20 family metallopeptidase [Vicinamibacterales bacterium]|nr:M20 family metallopeptidase [Vicinamibacterales bacterium]